MDSKQHKQARDSVRFYRLPGGERQQKRKEEVSSPRWKSAKLAATLVQVCRSHCMVGGPPQSVECPVCQEASQASRHRMLASVWRQGGGETLSKLELRI